MNPKSECYHAICCQKGYHIVGFYVFQNFSSVFYPKSDLELKFYNITCLSPLIIGGSRRGTFLEFLGKEQTYRPCAHSSDTDTI